MNTLEQFLALENNNAHLFEMNSMVEEIIIEMERGLLGISSSLPMIPAFIGDNFAPQAGEIVLAVDAGGTNLRISKIKFDSALMPTIITCDKYKMPGSQEPTNCDDFFATLAGYLVPHLNGVAKLGFCFSYAVEIQPSLDGKILSMSKEVVVYGCEGKMVGVELHRALEKHTDKPLPQITVLNDTVASLLGGRLFYHDYKYENYIGFILGTGTNICYYEPNGNIKKSNLLCDQVGSTIINVESANFNKLPLGKIDRLFLESTRNPEEHTLEKLISGQYLGNLLLQYLKSAAYGGLFSEKTSQSILALHTLQTRDIDHFLENTHKDSTLSMVVGSNTTDAKQFYLLIDVLLDRAARLTVCQFAACLQRSGKGSNPLCPVLITVEGTTYGKCELLRRKISYYVEQFLVGEKHLFVHLRTLDSVVTYGTALSAVHS